MEIDGVKIPPFSHLMDHMAACRWSLAEKYEATRFVWWLYMDLAGLVIGNPKLHGQLFDEAHKAMGAMWAFRQMNGG